jgi:hypothetical protein
MAALTADLAEVHTIMSKNIAEVLGQGEKLDSEYHSHIFVPACLGITLKHFQNGWTPQDIPSAHQAVVTCMLRCSGSSLSQEAVAGTRMQARCDLHVRHCH